MLIGLPSNRHVTGSNARNVLRQLRGVRCDKDSVAFCSHFVCLTRTCLMFRQLSVLRWKKNIAFVRIQQFSDDCLTKLSDWLKDLALVFQPMRGKTKTNRTLYAQFFSRALSTLQAIARNSDWFVELFAPVVIGRSNYFGTLIFRQSFENCFINYTSSFHSDEVLTLETSVLLYIYDDNLTFINSLDSKLLCLTSPSTYNLRFFGT